MKTQALNLISFFKPAQLILLLLLLVAYLSPVCAQTNPLVLKHADSMSFDRKVGKMSLYRDVFFTHDSLEFRTQWAKWNRRTDQVDFMGGFEFLHPKGHIKAKAGRYNRKTDFAQAWRGVFMRDSLGEITLGGDTLEYSRKTGIVEVWGNPILHKFPNEEEKKKALAKKALKNSKSAFLKKKSRKRKKQKSKSTGDEFGRPDDTLSISALKLRLDQDSRDAFAWDSVVIDRGKMHVTCDSAIFQYKKGYLKLSGSPVAQVGSYSVRGRQMEIWFKGESLQKMKVTWDAFGAQSDSTSIKDDVQWTEVEGDSMEVVFTNDDVDYLTVVGSGEGRFYEESKKDFINKVNGQSLVIDFEKGQPQDAKVREDASTRYFYFKESGEFGGWNEARGDSLDIGFQGSRLEKIAIQGNLASGVFMGENKSKNKKKNGKKSGLKNVKQLREIARKKKLEQQLNEKLNEQKGEEEAQNPKLPPPANKEDKNEP